MKKDASVAEIKKLKLELKRTLPKTNSTVAIRAAQYIPSLLEAGKFLENNLWLHPDVRIYAEDGINQRLVELIRRTFGLLEGTDIEVLRGDKWERAVYLPNQIQAKGAYLLDPFTAVSGVFHYGGLYRYFLSRGPRAGSLSGEVFGLQTWRHSGDGTAYTTGQCRPDYECEALKNLYTAMGVV